MQEELSLPSLFNRSESIFNKLQNPSGLSIESSQNLTEDALNYLQQASVLVDSLGLFSPNEDKDDLSTTDVKYLLIPYYQAELYSQIHNIQPIVRLGALQTALQRYKSFLLRTQQYGFTSDLSLLQRCTTAALDQKSDPTSLRELKIERFKAEKNIKLRLQALERRSLNNTNSNSEEEEEEDRLREIRAAQIHLAILKSSEQFALLTKEIEILQHAVSLPTEDDTRDSKNQQENHQSVPQDLLDQLRAAATHLGSSTTSLRNELRHQVFQPSHIMPSMTVEQFGDVEVAQMMERQRHEELNAKERKKMKDAMTASDQEDEEVYAQRAMDDFKDDNPRGWGNSKSKPCG